MLNLSCSPALHFVGSRSPCFGHAWNVGDLGESHEKQTISEQVGNPASRCSDCAMMVSHITDYRYLDQNKGKSIPGEVGMALYFDSSFVGDDGLSSQDALCVISSNYDRGENVNERNNDKNQHLPDCL